MKLLVEPGLVEREQRGRWAYDRPTTGVLAEAKIEKVDAAMRSFEPGVTSAMRSSRADPTRCR